MHLHSSTISKRYSTRGNQEFPNSKQLQRYKNGNTEGPLDQHMLVWVALGRVSQNE